MIQLKPQRSQKGYPEKYSVRVRSWFYRKLIGTKFKDLHKWARYKPFCFSDLIGFSGNRIEAGKTYKLILSVADKEICEALKQKIIPGEKFFIGDILYEVTAVRQKKVKVKDFTEMRSNVGVSLLEKRDDKPYSITTDKDGIPYFRKFLAYNLIRKFNYFHEFQVPLEYPILAGVEITKEHRDRGGSRVVNSHTTSKGHKFETHSSRLRIKCGVLDNVQQQVLNFCADTGFGTHTTYGIGFMHVSER